MAKKLMTLMFNKGNGELIGGYETDNAPKTVFENVRLKTLEYDPDLWYYRGDYETGGLVAVPSTDDSIIDEEQLDINVGQTIYTRYPVHKQINIIRRALQNMWGAGAPKEFLDMCTFIDDEINRNNARKEVYGTPNTPYVYVTKDEIEENVRKRMNDE